MVLERCSLEHLPGLHALVDAYLKERPHIDFPQDRRATDRADRAILALPSREQLVRVLTHVLDETSLLAPTGVRSLSKRHRLEPFVLPTPLGEYRVEDPGLRHQLQLAWAGMVSAELLAGGGLGALSRLLW
jgi:hypothetical protein